MADTLQSLYISAGAALAPDGIPLHFGDLAGEYQAALSTVVLFDRSHEGRLLLQGADRLDLVNRMSTNDVLHLVPGQGRSTVFANANGRVLYRVALVNRADDEALLLAGPGRGPMLAAYLKRNIFYGDKVSLVELSESHRQMALHGPSATDLLQSVTGLPLEGLALHHGQDGEIAGAAVYLARVAGLAGDGWVVLAAAPDAVGVWSALQAAGAREAGGMAYHALRIRAGIPGEGFELSDEFIPLELGLWHDISFNKGCYTGQEIIARMESRERLARLLVRLDLSTAVNPPADLLANGKPAGKLTSAVTAPDGKIWAMGVVKMAHAAAGTPLEVLGQADVVATVGEPLGTPPPYVQAEDPA